MPASYPTYLAANGPRHSLSPSGSLWLGACVDGEQDGQPTNDLATGDNIATGDPIYGTCRSAGDEDGVKRVQGKGGASNGGWTNGDVGPGSSGNGGAVEVTISARACLGAFFDFNRNPTVGNLQSVTLRDINGNIVVQPIAAGTYTFYFNIPPGNIQPQRADPTTALRQIPGHQPDRPIANPCAASTAFSPTGPAPDGEVEDYRWNFGPNAVTLSGMTASSAATPLALPLGIVTFLGVLVGGIVLRATPRMTVNELTG